MKEASPDSWAAQTPKASRTALLRRAVWLGRDFVVFALMMSVLLALMAAEVRGFSDPLAWLRLIFGLAFVLFVPGYSLQSALFPRQADLEETERLALCVGLSIAVIPPLALVLDYLPWGLRVWPIAIGLSVFVVACWLAAYYRRWRIPDQDQFTLIGEVDVRGWWASQDRVNRVLYGVLALALLTAAGSAITIAVSPIPGEHFTEFYMLGPESLAENFPREAVAGEQAAVKIGVANREGRDGLYTVIVKIGEQVIGISPIIALRAGEVWEQPVTFVAPKAGDDQAVDLVLERDGSASPYRTLRLWLNVTPAP